MHALPLSSVPLWKDWNGRWVPSSIDTVCPHCARVANLPLERFNFDGLTNSVSAAGKCPACGKVADLWIVRPGNTSDLSKKGCEELYIYPAPQSKREAIMPLDKLSPALARAYVSCLDSFNSGLWTTCAVSCRRALEGLAYAVAGEEAEKEELYFQLRKLPARVDLAEPLLRLVAHLKKGENMAAYVDLERDSNQATALAMVDLLDFTLEYAFAFRERAEALEARLIALEKAEGIVRGRNMPPQP